MKKSGAAKRKVFIVEDHQVVIEGLTQLLNREQDMTVCGTAGDVSSAEQEIAKCSPDVVITDLTLNDSHGLRLIENLTFNCPGIPVLVLSMHDESVYAERCLTAGARGYIMKQESAAEIIIAIRRILAGEVFVSEKVGARLLQKMVGRKQEKTGLPTEILSNRELEVYEMIGRGMKKSEIADALNLSIKTIETYAEHIKTKMNFKDGHELLMNAVKNFDSSK